MAMDDAVCSYRRVGGAGIVGLRSTVDASSAQTLHSVALQAAGDESISSIVVDLKEAQRLDLYAVQILIALTNHAATVGKPISADPDFRSVAQDVPGVA